MLLHSSASDQTGTEGKTEEEQVHEVAEHCCTGFAEDICVSKTVSPGPALLSTVNNPETQAHIDIPKANDAPHLGDMADSAAASEMSKYEVDPPAASSLPLYPSWIQMTKFPCSLPSLQDRRISTSDLQGDNLSTR